MPFSLLDGKKSQNLDNYGNFWFYINPQIAIQLNFVKANFIKTNNSVRRSESSVPNRILLILTKIQLFKSKYLCRTFYVSKHILRSQSGAFFIKLNGWVEPLFLSFRTYQPRPLWLSFEMIASQ